MCPLQSWGKTRNADVRSGLAQVSWSGVETLVHAAVGLGSSVTVFEHGIGRKMHVRRPKGPKSGYASHELDGLKFAPEPEFQNVTQGYVVGGGQRQRLQCRTVQIDIGGSQAAHGESHLRL